MEKWGQWKFQWAFLVGMSRYGTLSLFTRSVGGNPTLAVEYHECSHCVLGYDTPAMAYEGRSKLIARLGRFLYFYKELDQQVEFMC